MGVGVGVDGLGLMEEGGDGRRGRERGKGLLEQGAKRTTI